MKHRRRILPDPFFFFNDTATTEIYTLSLHDALPISGPAARARERWQISRPSPRRWSIADRKSTRLNSSHQIISYAVFCLKKKRPADVELERGVADGGGGRAPAGHAVRGGGRRRRTTR